MQRWLEGRTPYMRHRATVAKALGLEEADLWPDAVPTLPPADRSKELQGAWASFTDPAAPSWQKLMSAATQTIEACDYTLTGLIQTPGATSLLSNKANSGTTIRLLIAALDTPWLALEDPPSSTRAFAAETPLIQSLRQAHQRLWQLDTNTKVEARQALMPRCPAILRFDDDILLAIPLWGEQRQEPPVLHVHHRQQSGLFDRLTTHFQTLWDTSWILNPDLDQAQPRADPRTDSLPTEDGARKPGSLEALRRPTLPPYGRRPPRPR